MSMSATTIGTKGVPRPERERAILDVAVEEFATRGYAGASMIAIAAGAGISKPLIYQYFGSKDGLYLACLHRVAGGLLERLELAERTEVDDTAFSRVYALQAVFEALAPQPSAWRLLFDATLPADGEIADAAAQYRGHTERLAAAGSERFLQVRGNDDPLDAAVLSAVWRGLVDSVVTWWLAHPEETAEAMTRRCARLFAAVLDEPRGA